MSVLVLLCTILFLPAAVHADGPGYTVIRTPYALIQATADSGRQFPLFMDIYRPEPFDPARQYAGVLYIPGCGWITPPVFSEKHFREWAPHGIALARQGYIVFAIITRGGPFSFYPAPNEDAQYALKLITGQEHPEFIKQFCQPITDVALVGASSGGNIAALMGLSRQENNSAYVRCMVIYEGLMDLRHSERLPLITRLAVDLLYLPFHDAEDFAEASPICSADRAFCPVLLQMARDDWLLPSSQYDRMQQALEDRGIPVEKYFYDSNRHAFQYQETRIADAARSLTVAFISRYLPQPR